MGHIVTHLQSVFMVVVRPVGVRSGKDVALGCFSILA